jgi:cobalt-zinc-cadmium efflux system membrane fusion protein
MKKLSILIIAGLLASCSHQEPQENTGPENVQETSPEGIELTGEQKERAGLVTGGLEQRTLARVVYCTGKLEALPQHHAEVSPPLGGFIQTIHYATGEKVSRGDVLVTLRHPAFFDLQQQYLETRARMEYYEEEYKRQGELTVENAASMKTMQQAKADYYVAEAKYKSLKAQLALLGVDATQIEQGDLVPAFTLKAPVSGVVTSVNGNTGMFAGPETPVMKIIDDRQLYVTLSVLEKDLAKVAPGQRVTFQTLNSDRQFETTLKHTGHTIDPESRMVRVMATIDNPNGVLRAGMFVDAQVLTAEKKVYALPVEAILEHEEGAMVFMEKDNRYYPVAVEKGMIREGWCELVNPAPELINQQIVIRGGYYLQSVLEIME